jgi:CcmD family protein
MIFLQATRSAVEMADAFRADGKIYVVIAVLGIIFVGLITYLIYLDKKISRLEKRNRE